MANISIKQAISMVATAAKNYTDSVASKKVDAVSGKGLSSNDLTTQMVNKYEEAYTHSQSAHLVLGETSGTAYRGDRGKIAYDHSQSAHAPSNAQPNSAITKAEIEAKLTGNISTHAHDYLPLSGGTLNGNLTLSGSLYNNSLTTGSTSLIQIVGGDKIYLGNKKTPLYLLSDDNPWVTIGTTSYQLFHSGNPQVDITGNAGSANKVNKALSIQLNGGSATTFDGSAVKSINVTAESVGASAIGHVHDDRYYTEGEIDGKVSTLNTAISTAKTEAINSSNSYTDNKVAGLLDSAPETLNTLNELAAALGDDPNFATTVATEIGKKADKEHGTHLVLGTGAGNAYRGDYGNIAYNHSQAAHAPANAQKNSDITKAEIENVLRGEISTHSHAIPWANVEGQPNGVAATGESSRVAREDHVHPLQVNVTGNAGTATKLQNPITIIVGKAKIENFDGTSDINISLVDMGVEQLSEDEIDTMIDDIFGTEA